MNLLKKIVVFIEIIRKNAKQHLTSMNPPKRVVLIGSSCSFESIAQRLILLTINGTEEMKCSKRDLNA